MTKEEYIAKMMSAKAEGKESRFKVLLALAKEEEDIEEMVSELEAVIQRLRQDIE